MPRCWNCYTGTTQNRLAKAIGVGIPGAVLSIYPHQGILGRDLVYQGLGAIYYKVQFRTENNLTRLQQEIAHWKRSGEMATVETIITLYERGIITPRNNQRADIKDILQEFFTWKDADYWLDYYGIK